MLGFIELFGQKKCVKDKIFLGDIENMVRKVLILLAGVFMASCTGAFYYPTHNEYSLPSDQGLDYEDVFFESLDGIELHAWTIRPSTSSDPENFIVHFHGNAQNLSSHFFHLSWAVPLGVELFIFDYRGYGKSEKMSPSPSGLHKDGISALNHAYQLFKSSEANRFIVYGQSLGGVVLLSALEEFEYRDSIDLMVLDSTFYSYRSIASQKMKDLILTWPLHFLVPLLVQEKKASKDFLTSLELPTLIIHSKKDPVVPYSMGIKIDHLLKMNSKWFWTLEERGHGDVFSYPYHRTRFMRLINDL